MSSEDDFLMGGGIPSASLLKRGDSVEGTICAKPSQQQQRDFDSGKPKFWENGDPMMQLVVTLQTEELDDEIEDDDGRRRLFVKYKMRDAIRDAVKDAKAPGLREGGWLKVTYTHSDKPKRRGMQGTKYYKAEYEAPDENAATDDYLGDEGDDGDSYTEPDDKPARPAKKAAAKKSSRRAAQPDDDLDEYTQDDDDEPDEKPARRASSGRGQPAKKAARGSGRGRGSDEEPF